MAIVKVSAIGKTVLHTVGWRAERIRVEEIYVPHSTPLLRRLLARQFSAPVYQSWPAGYRDPYQRPAA
jgi:hypothetical protein